MVENNTSWSPTNVLHKVAALIPPHPTDEETLDFLNEQFQINAEMKEVVDLAKICVLKLKSLLKKTGIIYPDEYLLDILHISPQVDKNKHPNQYVNPGEDESPSETKEGDSANSSSHENIVTANTLGELNFTNINIKAPSKPIISNVNVNTVEKETTKEGIQEEEEYANPTFTLEQSANVDDLSLIHI